MITSGGGSGGVIWYIARLNGEAISEKIQKNIDKLQKQHILKITKFLLRLQPDIPPEGKATKQKLFLF